MQTLCERPATVHARLLATGEITARELVTACLHRYPGAPVVAFGGTQRAHELRHGGHATALTGLPVATARGLPTPVTEHLDKCGVLGIDATSDDHATHLVQIGAASIAVTRRTPDLRRRTLDLAACTLPDGTGFVVRDAGDLRLLLALITDRPEPGHLGADLRVAARARTSARGPHRAVVREVAAVLSRLGITVTSQDTPTHCLGLTWLVRRSPARTADPDVLITAVPSEASTRVTVPFAWTSNGDALPVHLCADRAELAPALITLARAVQRYRADRAPFRS